jgi:predicted AAA+ superfamily ATPase
MQKQIEIHNPWKKDQSWHQEGIRRFIFKKILESLENEYITVIKGPRQSGKTFLIKQLISSLLNKGISPNNIFYFLFDDLDLLNYVEEHPSEFLNYVISESEKSGRLYIILDEFQKVKQLTSLVKNLFEAKLPLKFILLGSSTLLISEKVSESLFGRTQTFILYPFSFGEYIICKNEKIPQEQLQAILKKVIFDNPQSFENLEEFYKEFHFIITQRLNNLLNSFFLIGGYPQASLCKKTEDSFLRLKEIKQAYLEKDIIALLKIEKNRDFEKLVNLLSLITSQLVNYANLQRDLGISFQTLKKFLNILEGTFLLNLCSNFTSSKISSLKKMPKVFFFDNGLRNFFSSTFDEISLEKEKGILSENFVFSQLIKFNAWQLNEFGKVQFWRSPSGNEIDFIFSYRKNIIPIEVKLSQPLGRGAEEFLKRLNPDRIFIVTKDRLEIQKKGNVYYMYIPLSIFGLGLV